MEGKTIEWTWEEVARRAGEFAGHRIRVTVLDELEAPEGGGETRAETTGMTAFNALARAGLIGCLKAALGGPTDLATNPSHMEGFGGE